MTEPIQESPKAGPISQPLLSVVLSFYNEEGVLPELIRRLRTVLQRNEKGDNWRL